MKMKNIFRLILVAAVLSTIISCQKEDDPPAGGGTGLDRDKFMGTWHVTSNHTITSQQFWDMTVVAGSSNSEMRLANFDQIGGTNSIIASVSGNNFSFSQTHNGTQYQGSGSYSSGNLSFSYTADDGVQVDTVSATAQR
jgi:hypothetical protein